MLLRVTAPTVFKARPIDSRELPFAEKVNGVPGQEFKILRTQTHGHHQHVTLAEPLNGSASWYVFTPHILIVEDAHPHLDEHEVAEVEPVLRGRVVTILGTRFGMGDSIVPGSNFTWGEATKNGTRIPQTRAIANNIVRMAAEMDVVRKLLGDRSCHITSWYRPPAVNLAVGGASRSQHLTGLGVDFWVVGLAPQQVQAILKPFWPGGLGYGRTFTHLDGRHFAGGARARFNY